LDEHVFFNDLIIGWFIVAAVTFPALLFVVAPYGRHARKGWGPTIGNRLGWIVMEAPAALVFALFFALGQAELTIPAVVLFCLWEAHYVHRSFIYPLGLRGEGKRMPLSVVGMGVLFNAVNGYLNGRYIFTFSGAGGRGGGTLNRLLAPMRCRGAWGGATHTQAWDFHASLC